MALLLLFIFAIFASGYVLKEGLRKKEKTTHELLLKCVIIITSVVPRQLPMQVMPLFYYLCCSFVQVSVTLRGNEAFTTILLTSAKFLFFSVFMSSCPTF